MKIIDTTRLYLREFVKEDALSLYQLNLDAEVIKYTGYPPFQNLLEAQQFLTNYNHYQKHGFGRWAVIRKSDNTFLGWCGLKYSEALQEVDLGFRFFKAFWNQGYASEAAFACIDFGFSRLQLSEIVGRAMKANTASIRVLEKVGMTFDRLFDFEGKEGVVYKIRNRLF